MGFIGSEAAMKGFIAGFVTLIGWLLYFIVVNLSGWLSNRRLSKPDSFYDNIKIHELKKTLSSVETYYRNTEEMYYHSKNNVFYEPWIMTIFLKNKAHLIIITVDQYYRDLNIKVFNEKKFEKGYLEKDEFEVSTTSTSDEIISQINNAISTP